ncbi:MAG: penicillin acylase family protein [Nitratireductor sp.]
MHKFYKWALGGFLSLALIFSIVGLAAFFIVYFSIPKVKGEMALKGLGQNASIMRDVHHIPHIHAVNKLDAIRLLGFAHATDRLWQMEVSRYAAQGRLSELFGAKTIETDRFIQSLDLVTPSKSSFDLLNENTKALLIAYSEGVNAFAQRKAGSLNSNLPPEFVVFGHAFEDWEPWHSIALLKLMALTLDNNMGHEIGRLMMAAKGFEPSQIDLIYSYDQNDKPEPLPDLRNVYGWDSAGKPDTDKKAFKSTKPFEKIIAQKPFDLVFDIHRSASNSWAVSGDRSTTQMPLLANDPHLNFTAPAALYLAHLKIGAGEQIRNVIGGTIAGIPAILVGRNDYMAWGLTTAKLDSQDLFIERLNPLNSEEYLAVGKFVKFDETPKEIKVRGKASVKFIRKQTRNGPVLPLNYRGLSKYLPKGHVASLGWVALAIDDTTIEGAMEIMDAGDVEALMVSAKKLVAPMQNIMSADKDGNIGLIGAGRIPVRSSLNKIKGRAPVLGWMEKHRWQDFVSSDDLPKQINPFFRTLIAANGKTVTSNYKHHITYDWSEGYRQRRIEDNIVSQYARQSPESLQAGMADTYSKAMVLFRDLGVSQLSGEERINGLLLDKIRDWNGYMRADSVVPLILNAWLKQANELLFKDDFGDAFSFLKHGNVTRVLSALNSRASYSWCDDVTSRRFISCESIIRKALDLAVLELNQKYGSNWNNWLWGEAHKAVHVHQPFGSLPIINKLFNLTNPIAGGKYTLLRSTNSFNKKDPYATSHGAAYRAVYDLEDLDNSRYIISTGQSGHVLSKHYDDMNALWSQNKYILMSTKEADYKPSALGELKFSPLK